MFRVFMKLKNLKPELKLLNQKVYSRISTRVKIAKEESVTHQIMIQHGGVETSAHQREKELLMKYIG